MQYDFNHYNLKINHVNDRLGELYFDDNVVVFDKCKGPLDTRDNYLCVSYYLRHVLVDTTHHNYKYAIKAINYGEFDEIWNVFLNDDSIETVQESQSDVVKLNSIKFCGGSFNGITKPFRPGKIYYFEVGVPEKFHPDFENHYSQYFMMPPTVWATSDPNIQRVITISSTPGDVNDVLAYSTSNFQPFVCITTDGAVDGFVPTPGATYYINFFIGTYDESSNSVSVNNDWECLIGHCIVEFNTFVLRTSLYHDRRIELLDENGNWGEDNKTPCNGYFIDDIQLKPDKQYKQLLTTLNGVQFCSENSEYLNLTNTYIDFNTNTLVPRYFNSSYSYYGMDLAHGINGMPIVGKYYPRYRFKNKVPIVQYQEYLKKQRSNSIDPGCDFLNDSKHSIGFIRNGYECQPNYCNDGLSDVSGYTKGLNCNYGNENSRQIDTDYGILNKDFIKVGSLNNTEEKKCSQCIHNPDKNSTLNYNEYCTNKDSVGGCSNNKTCDTNNECGVYIYKYPFIKFKVSLDNVPESGKWSFDQSGVLINKNSGITKLPFVASVSIFPADLQPQVDYLNNENSQKYNVEYARYIVGSYYATGLIMHPKSEFWQGIYHDCKNYDRCDNGKCKLQDAINQYELTDELCKFHKEDYGNCEYFENNIEQWSNEDNYFEIIEDRIYFINFVPSSVYEDYGSFKIEINPVKGKVDVPTC